MTTATRTIKRWKLDEIIDAATNQLSGGAEIHDGYSGRGVYGATCPAIVLDHACDLMVIGVAAAQILEDREDEKDDYCGDEFDPAYVLARNASVDSMGHGIVVYFPGYTLDES